MADLKRISGVDINQDMDYQRREWRAERIAWVFFSLVIVAALLGLLGQGPLSAAHAGDPTSGLELDWQRIDRNQAPTQLTLTLAPQLIQGGAARVTFNEEYLDRIEIEEIVPEPESVETGADGVTYQFETKDTSQPIQVKVDYQYARPGMARGEVGVEGGPSLRFESFVWP
jgi:hypothetical protein